ncbi:hypothetical protein CR513_42250, partial [Mucuna pruriens]
MEVALTRTNVLESIEATIARFLHRLNRDIQGIMLLYYYSSLDDLVHHTIRVEGQQKSCVNVASSRMVEKLKLTTLAHPKPYKL